MLKVLELVPFLNISLILSQKMFLLKDLSCINNYEIFEQKFYWILYLPIKIAIGKAIDVMNVNFGEIK
jgi:hypothetical protein